VKTTIILNPKEEFLSFFYKKLVPIKGYHKSLFSSRRKPYMDLMQSGEIDLEEKLMMKICALEIAKEAI
jgi:hypothetical protein